ncbi:MAG: hypothetical protein LBQ66_05105, partial [Planctomycetaceae bacterium]|nr:hypothetical protein [Planctomycetaceae bacterium]
VGDRKVVNRPPGDQRKVDNRPLGGCVFGERSKTKTVDRQNMLVHQNVQNVGRVGFGGASWRSSCRLTPT